MMLSLAISLSLVGTARANGVRRVGRAVPLRTRTLLSSHFAPSPVKRFSTIYLSLLLFLLSLTLFSLCLSLFLSICSICSFFPLSFTINRHCIYALSARRFIINHPSCPALHHETVDIGQAWPCLRVRLSRSVMPASAAKGHQHEGANGICPRRRA
jgi:hypothetical protein